MPFRNQLPVLGYGVRSLDGKILTTPYNNSDSETFDVTTLNNNSSSNSSGEHYHQSIEVIHDNQNLQSALNKINSNSNTSDHSSYYIMENNFKKTTIDTQAIYILIQGRNLQSHSLKANYFMKPSIIEDTVANARIKNFSSLNAFYTAYGDHFVSQIDFGSQVTALIKVEYYFTSTKENESSSCLPNLSSSQNIFALEQNKAEYLNLVVQYVAALASGKKPPADTLKVGSSSASSWIDTLGIQFQKDGQSHINANTLSDLMNSISSLLISCQQSCGKTALSYQTSSHSGAQINYDPSNIPVISQPSIKQSDLTVSLQVIDNYISAIRALWSAIDFLQQRVNTYLKKYEEQLETIDDEQHETYRRGRNEKRADKIQNNHRQLAIVEGELRIMSDHLISGIRLKNQHHVTVLQDKLFGLQEIADIFINDYTITNTDLPIQTVNYDGKKTQPFTLPTSSSSSQLFFKLKGNNDNSLPSLKLCRVDSTGATAVALINDISECITLKNNASDTQYILKPSEKLSTFSKGCCLFNSTAIRQIIEVYHENSTHSETAPSLSELNNASVNTGTLNNPETNKMLSNFKTVKNIRAEVEMRNRPSNTDNTASPSTTLSLT